MSVIIAVKTKTGITFACDNQNTNSGISTYYKKGVGKWIQCENLIIATTGDVFVRHWIRTWLRSKIFRDQNIYYDIRSLTVALEERFSNTDYEFDILLGVKDSEDYRLFKISDKYEAMEIDEVGAIGSGAIGVYVGFSVLRKEYNSASAIEELIEISIKETSKIVTSVGGEVIFGEV